MTDTWPASRLYWLCRWLKVAVAVSMSFPDAHPAGCPCLSQHDVCSCSWFPSLSTMEVEFSARGRRANLWLSRPACRNALSKLALRELIRACDALQLRHDTTIVVLAGRGKSFCAGADLNDAPGVVDTTAGVATKSVAAGDNHSTGRNTTLSMRHRRYAMPLLWCMPLADQHSLCMFVSCVESNGHGVCVCMWVWVWVCRHAAQLGLRAIRALESLDAITIAQVHGHAAGGGLGLMVACDFRVVLDGTRLWWPEVDLGIPLTWGLTAKFAAEVGLARAKEWISLGTDIPLHTAKQIGLVNTVVDGKANEEGLRALDAAVDAVVHALLKKSAAALHMIKSQFVALSRRASFGDVTLGDRELFVLTRLQAKL